MDKTDFKKGIKELRNKKGLSQEELANLSGLSLRTIQRIESGETNPYGNTKRKIIKIIESYPNIDFSEIRNGTVKKSFFQKIFEKWEYIIVIYLFSLLGILMGFIGFKSFFLVCFSLGFLCIIFLTISVVYQIKIKGWQRSRAHLIVILSSLIIYFLIISLIIPVKHNKTQERVTQQIRSAF